MFTTIPQCYTLSLHDALPILRIKRSRVSARRRSLVWAKGHEPLIWAAVKFCFMCRRNPAARRSKWGPLPQRSPGKQISREEADCIIRAATAADREAATPPLALCVIVRAHPLRYDGE